MRKSKRTSRKRRPVVTEIVNELLKLVMAHEGQPLAWVIADLESPEWPKGPSNWSFFVSSYLRDLWPRLSLEAKAAVRFAVQRSHSL